MALLVLTLLLLQAVLSSQQGHQQQQQKLQLPYPCYLPKKPGFCKAYFPRFFYNAAAGECQQFIYGGCGGNDNNFQTLQECQQAC